MNIETVLKTCKRNFSRIHLDDKFEDAILFFNRRNCKEAIVLDENQALCGIVTEHDIVRHLGEKEEALSEKTVGDIMSLDLVVCMPETSLDEAVKLMSDNNIQHLPVVSDAGHLLGFVNIMELLLGVSKQKNSADS